jgi:H+/Cl- antiporter ClcA
MSHILEKLKITFSVLFIALIMSCLGSFFLFALQWAKETRSHFPYLLFGLPFLGFGVTYMYAKWGKSVEKGTNLIIEEIDQPKKKIDWLMTPFILFSTIGSHLFGASVGREGTAVQMGGAVGDQFSALFSGKPDLRVMLIRCGVAAGFAAVFGTPLAGVIFAFEFDKSYRFNIYSFIPVVFCSFFAFGTTQQFHPPHTNYEFVNFPSFSFWSFWQCVLAGACFGLVARLFIELIKFFQKQAERISYAPYRALVGGSIFVLCICLIGLEKGERFLGLGLEHLVFSFHHKIEAYDFMVKLVLTALLIATGFKGGEVTPLFFIGATLGSILSFFIPLPMDFLAALGMVAVFGAAANTPITATAIAYELFDIQEFDLLFFCCLAAFICVGKASIYKSQLIEQTKFTIFKFIMKKSD